MVGHQETAAGGGSPQESKSVATDNVQPKLKIGNTGDNGTEILGAETLVSPGPSKNSVSLADKLAASGQRQGGVTDTDDPGNTSKPDSSRVKKGTSLQNKLPVGALSNLNEDQLIFKLREHLQSMTNFCLKPRNVHKELKEGVPDTVKVFRERPPT